MGTNSSLGDMVVRIVGDNSEFDAAIDKSKNKFTKFAKTAEQAGKKLTTFVTLPLLAAAGAMVKFAIDAEETRDKFTTAFRGIENQADATASNLADNFGLSTTQAEKLLSGTGDLLKGFGATASEALDLSDRVQQLAVDLDSYNNLQGGADQASQALTSAMLGEREALKSLGIVVSEELVNQELLRQGQEDLEGQALLLAKAEATLNLAISQSGDAIGSFAATADSAKNRLVILKASVKDIATSFGQTMMPVVEKLIGHVERLIGWFADLDEQQRETIIIIGAVAASIGPLLLGIKAVSLAIPIVTAAVKFLSGAMAFLSAHPIVLVLAGIAAIVTVVALLVKRYKQAKIDQDNLGHSMEELKRNTDDATRGIKELNDAYRTNALFSEQRRQDVDREIAQTEFLIATMEASIESLLNNPLSKFVIVPEVQQELDANIAKLAELKEALIELKRNREAFISGTLWSKGDDPIPKFAKWQEVKAEVLDTLKEQQRAVIEQNNLAIAQGETFDLVGKQKDLLRDAMRDLVTAEGVDEPFTITDDSIQDLLESLAALGTTEAELEEIRAEAGRLEAERIAARIEAMREITVEEANQLVLEKERAAEVATLISAESKALRDKVSLSIDVHEQTSAIIAEEIEARRSAAAESVESTLEGTTARSDAEAELLAATKDAELHKRKTRAESNRLAIAGKEATLVFEVATHRAVSAIAEIDVAEAVRRRAMDHQFNLENRDEIQQEIDAINERREAYIDAGIAKVEVDKWADAQIKIIRDNADREEQNSEATRISIRQKFYNSQKTEREKILQAIKDEAEAYRQAGIAEDEVNAWVIEERQRRLGQYYISFATTILSSVSNVISAIGNLQKQSTDRRIAEIDRELQAELAANGLAEESTIDRLKDQLTAAEEANDAEAASAIRAEIVSTTKREAIISDFESQKADIAYQGALVQWKLNIVLAIADAALAVLNALQIPPPLSFITAGLAGVAGAIGVAAVIAAKPQKPPSLAQGGIALPSPGGQIVRVAEAGQPEVIAPLDKLSDILSTIPSAAVPNTGSGDLGNIELVVQMDSEPILKTIFPATRDQRVLISANAVVS